MTTCRNCGYEVAEWSEVKKAVMREYNFTDEELEDGKIVVRVYHPDCAVSDGRIEEGDQGNLPDPFYWDSYRQ